MISFVLDAVTRDNHIHTSIYITLGSRRTAQKKTFKKMVMTCMDGDKPTHASNLTTQAHAQRMSYTLNAFERSYMSKKPKRLLDVNRNCVHTTSWVKQTEKE